MLSSKELDLQSPVKIDEWLDIDSEKCKELDDYRAFTLKCINYNLFQTDNLGRLWGFDAKKNIYFPFHFEVGKKLYGYRQAKKALN